MKCFFTQCKNQPIKRVLERLSVDGNLYDRIYQKSVGKVFQHVVDDSTEKITKIEVESKFYQNKFQVEFIRMKKKKVRVEQKNYIGIRRK